MHVNMVMALMTPNFDENFLSISHGVLMTYEPVVKQGKSVTGSASTTMRKSLGDVTEEQDIYSGIWMREAWF